MEDYEYNFKIWEITELYAILQREKIAETIYFKNWLGQCIQHYADPVEITEQ